MFTVHRSAFSGLEMPYDTAMACIFFFWLFYGILIKKNPACRILRLRRGALATLFLSAAVRSSRSVFDFIGRTFL